MDKIITILGSTGSIGRQSIEVAVRNSIRVEAVSAHTSVDALERQARELKVKYAAMTDEASAKKLKERLSDTDIKVFEGASGLLSMLSVIESETVINALVGMSGLQPTVTALENGKRVAIANKESLVCAGEIVMALSREKALPIIPVDSEHSAIWQCLSSGERSDVSRLILTASGGPFFGRKKEDIYYMTKKEALCHPTWSMGEKITVDSASMMNKGFEIMEAVYLFDMPSEKVDVLVHRQSIVHSMVEFCDGAVIAQMGIPDMKCCISLALSYPERYKVSDERLDLAKISSLTFAKPDDEAFPLMSLARLAVSEGGLLPAVLCAADEACVRLFLDGKIKFGEISDIVAFTVHNYINRKNPSLEEIYSVCSSVEREILSKY